MPRTVLGLLTLRRYKKKTNKFKTLKKHENWPEEVTALSFRAEYRETRVSILVVIDSTTVYYFGTMLPFFLGRSHRHFFHKKERARVASPCDAHSTDTVGYPGNRGRARKRCSECTSGFDGSCRPRLLSESSDGAWSFPALRLAPALYQRVCGAIGIKLRTTNRLIVKQAPWLLLIYPMGWRKIKKINHKKGVEANRKTKST